MAEFMEIRCSAFSILLHVTPFVIYHAHFPSSAAFRIPQKGGSVLSQVSGGQIQLLPGSEHFASPVRQQTAKNFVATLGYRKTPGIVEAAGNAGKTFAA